MHDKVNNYDKQTESNCPYRVEFKYEPLGWDSTVKSLPSFTTNVDN